MWDRIFFLHVEAWRVARARMHPKHGVQYMFDEVSED